MDEMQTLCYNITMEHLSVNMGILRPEDAYPRIRKLLEDYGQKMYDRGVTASLGGDFKENNAELGSGQAPENTQGQAKEFSPEWLRGVLAEFKPDPVTGDCICDSCRQARP